MTDKTGGPTFPTTKVLSASGGEVADSNGMTLRDYFAAKAMQEFAGAWLLSETTLKILEIAEASYKVADAMLKAREL